MKLKLLLQKKSLLIKIMTKNFIKVLCTFILFTLSLSAYSAWQWTKVKSLGNGKRFESTSFSINGKGYVTCGVDTNDNCYNDLWEYDPVFNFWTQKANLPASYRRAAFGFEINGKGYMGGGIDDAISSVGNIFNQFWMYDPSLNTWTSKANLPISVFRAAGISCNGKGYMIGGADDWSLYNNVYEYNPLTDNWTAKANFPGHPNSSGGREAGTGTTVNNKIYFGLGKDDSYFQNDWWEFNPVTNAWVRKMDFPVSGRTGAWSFAINNKAVVGMGSDGSFASDTWWYDAVANTWNYTCSFSGDGRRSVAAFAINNIGYMGTGKANGGTKQDFYKLDSEVGIQELTNNQSLFTVFPNPISTNEFTISVEVELLNASILIFNAEGKLLKTETLNHKEHKINRDNFSAGLYFISIKNKDQLLSTKKIILL
jgi:N-acetylneuraminic acid mutarotase